MPPALRALASRNYRIYFAGQLVSLAGTCLLQIAMEWLAYRLTGSALVPGRTRASRSTRGAKFATSSRA